jgi:hypothetical protein
MELHLEAENTNTAVSTETVSKHLMIPNDGGNV